MIHRWPSTPSAALTASRPRIATLRWTQEGFSPSNNGGTPRNLMGFKDGTMNSNLQPPADLGATLWAGAEGPAWMRGGTYLVYRRIRMMLEQWDRLAPDTQEQVIGRRKLDGAPLGQSSEFSPLDLGKLDDQGNWVVPVLSHVRIASPLVNEGAVVVRRSFSYANGTTPGATRSPEHRDFEYDRGVALPRYKRVPTGTASCPSTTSWPTWTHCGGSRRIRPVRCLPFPPQPPVQATGSAAAVLA